MRIFINTFLLSIVLYGSCKDEHVNNMGNDALEFNEHEKTSAISSELNADYGRLSWQKPELVIESLGDISGKKIADIGAGTGYFTFRFNKKGAKVIAIDVNPQLMKLIEIFRENLDSLAQTQIETRLVPPDDPKLLQGEVDIAVIINTLGYIENKEDYLKKVKKGIKQGGVLMIVDFKTDVNVPSDIAPPLSERIAHQKVQEILISAGYELIRVNETNLPYQYMIWSLI